MLSGAFYSAFFLEQEMTDTSMQSDLLQRFIFNDVPVRGEWVHLTDSWQQVLARRNYPPAIQQLLGEMMAAAALLAATVKIKGRLVLQIKSVGPVTLMMVECTSKNTLRAFAQWDGDVADNTALLDLTGDGTLAITIEVNGAKQPYQGVVSLQGNSISDVLEVYFQQSEQLKTRIWLAANDNVVAGLFLQQLPDEHQDEEDWSTISQLAATVTANELLELGADTLLYRLFSEQQCRLLVATELSFACNCSRDRVATSISFLGKKDADDLLKEQGSIEVTCEFCNEHYYFDNIEVAQVFVEEKVISSNSETLH